jgi:hypothetical protein
MSQSAVGVREQQGVVASLQPGPKGTVRLSYGSTDPDQVRHFLEGLVPRARMQHAYAAPSVFEIDRAKLLQLKFSQEGSWRDRFQPSSQAIRLASV